jgi:hypothetical protein
LPGAADGTLKGKIIGHKTGCRPVLRVGG